jgi:hypothetical protein
MELKHEGCRVCGKPVRLMCQQGTGYCSQLCENVIIDISPGAFIEVIS